MTRTSAVAAMLCLLSLPSAAQVPEKISWQGYLTDENGQPLEGPVRLVFRLYDMKVGGTLLYEKDTTGVVADRGVVGVPLGPFKFVDFNETRYLGIRIGDGEELTPRSEWNAVPHALSLRGLRIIRDGGYAPAGSRSLVGGSDSNVLAPDAFGATIAGGGSASGSMAIEPCTPEQSLYLASNIAYSAFGTIGGGLGNQACGEATVSGGRGNTASGLSSTVGGGYQNSAEGYYATVPGGTDNAAKENYTFAAGRGAIAAHEGSFVWADGSNSCCFTSTGENQFLIRAGGGVGIGTATLDPSNRLTLYGGDLSLQTNNNSLDQSILFQNSGQFYTWRIYRKDAGSNSASLRIAGGANADKTLLSDRMVFAADGHIGIGTDAPVGLLNVSGTDIVRFDRTDNGNALLGLLASTGREWRLISTGSSDNHGSGLFQIRDATQNIDRLTITTTGEVGVGTAAPANRLSVDGSADISGALGVGTSAPATPLAVNAGLGGNDVGITQGQLGGSHAMELTTSDADGDQATRLLLYGASDGTDIAFYRGGRGAEALSMSIKGASGRVGIGTNIPAKLLDVNGDLVAVSVTETSDARLKTGIEPISHPLETVRDLQGVAYYWNRDRYPKRNLGESRRIGFLAQDVARVLPEVVDEGADGLLSVNYGHVVALLVEALKERDRKTEALEGRVAQLERMVLAFAETRKATLP